MKLRGYTASIDEKMLEFDIWITPTLGEIRDTDQFRSNLDLLKMGFDILCSITNDFNSLELCNSSALADGIEKLIREKPDNIAKGLLDGIFNVCLLATGKTDNNLKCQYPILLRKVYGITQYPKKQGRNWTMKELPRTISIEEVTKFIIQLKCRSDFQKMFIESYIHLIVSDEVYAKQLLSLGNAYVNQKKIGAEDYLISSIVVFQSRGSITATQGHIPEAILRRYMSEWGMKSGSDFNEQDVEIGELLEGMPADDKLKKRKYDFVIPYQSRTGGAKVFIQSQFYAGDSGSVSHKVVDQTDSSRAVTLKKYPEAVFIEYLDGAGYYSSLNGDLRKMLSKPTTKEFFQIKTAPIKLRRELQNIDFLTVLEIEHAILRSNGSKEEVSSILQSEGYSESEIATSISEAIKNEDILCTENNVLSIKESRLSTVRRYCLLDLLANYGEQLNEGQAAGSLMVAGYMSTWGMQQADLIRLALERIPNLATVWPSPVTPFDDLQWLLNHEFITAK